MRIRMTMLMSLAAALTAAGTAQAQTQPGTAQHRMVRPGHVVKVPRVTPPAPIMATPPLVSTPSTPGGGVVRLVNTKPAASDAGRPSGPIVPPGQVQQIDNTVQPLSANYLGLAPMPTERTFQNPPGHSFAPRTIVRTGPVRERPNSDQADGE
ncbi:MAG: hypothetical protein SFV19_08890 [Rhodospirillaceae bacterium]|nr:hypothetical protein [Rhodospirillaceae bacterium]